LDLKQIKQIIDIMKKSSLTEFEIEEKDLKLRICRSDENQGNGAAAMPAYAAPVPAYTPPPAAPAPAEAAAGEVEEKGVVVIKSPMVGTFYTASSFVSVGDSINKDTTVCIIEAMKVMNEIPAELSGSIKEILVENGDAVEYGQPLFKVKS
jgi:acetyl-CoA carboxylase biotin carboxyl carrier protein